MNKQDSQRSSTYLRGYNDCLNCRTCLVYRKRDGGLKWNSDYQNGGLAPEDAEQWAKDYIEGWTACEKEDDDLLEGR